MIHIFLFLLLSLYLSPGQSKDLLNIYELALERDPGLQEAEAIRNAIFEARPQSISRLLPELSFTGHINRNSVLSKFGANPSTTQQQIAGAREVEYWDSSASLVLRQPIYNHQFWVELSQSDNLVAQAQASYEAALQDLAFRVTKAYLDILYAQDSLEFALAEKRAVERQLDQAKARFEVELIAVNDVNEAQAAYDRSRANLIRAENDLGNAKEALREIIGQFEDDLSPLRADIPLELPTPDRVDDWAERALETNLTVIAMTNGAELARKNIDLAFSGHLPTLDLVGSAGFTDNNRPRGISTESWRIGMQVNVPLFQGNYVNSRTRQAQHELEAALKGLDKQRRLVTRMVTDAYRGVVSSIGQAEALKAAVSSSQSALEASEAGLEVGTRTMVDVLNEQRNLYEAKRNYAKARYDYIINSLLLKQAASILQREDIELFNRWLIGPGETETGNRPVTETP
jgi:outer membrane protein